VVGACALEIAPTASGPVAQWLIDPQLDRGTATKGWFFIVARAGDLRAVVFNTRTLHFWTIGLATIGFRMAFCY